jgi:hypothetical protein
MEWKKTLATSSGMWGIWDYETYKNISNYDQWSRYFEEDNNIVQQIINNHFVPINIGSDGVFEFNIKMNENLTDREKKYVIASSEPYLIKSNGILKISGIEYIDKNIREEQCISVKIEPSMYSVIIRLIDWKQEMGMVQSDGKPKKEALSDFIIEISENICQNKNNNISLKTFGR